MTIRNKQLHVNGKSVKLENSAGSVGRGLYVFHCPLDV